MNILIGVPFSGTQKNYCIEPFTRMANAVYHDCDVLFVVDEPGKSQGFDEVVFDTPPSDWCTDICFLGREQLRREAINRGYDYYMWQGIDCWMKSRQEFELLLDLASREKFVGALVAGRNRPDYPVCRSFKTVDGKLTTEQEELDWKSIDLGVELKTPGFIGGDATIIHKSVFSTVSIDDYIPWETIYTQMENTVCSDEFYTYKAIKSGITPVCHTGVRPWHCHEDLYAARYPGERVHMSEISW